MRPTVVTTQGRTEDRGDARSGAGAADGLEALIIGSNPHLGRAREQVEIVTSE
jgi:hypothetical protein